MPPNFYTPLNDPEEFHACSMSAAARCEWVSHLFSLLRQRKRDDFSRRENIRNMPTRLNIYPIDGLSQSWQDDPFDHSKLPADIVSGVTIENVKKMFNEE